MNKIRLAEALRACNLQGSVSTQRLHYYVKMAKKAVNKEGMVIDVVNICEEDGTATTSTSPLTEPSSSSLSHQLLCCSDLTTDTAAEEQDKENLVDNLQDSSSPLQPQPPAAPHNGADDSCNIIKARKTRRSSRQTSVAKLEAKREYTAYNNRFKMAFKEATELIAGKSGCTRGESVPCLVEKLNCKYNLVGKRKLSRSTVYRAVQCGKIGQSPCKKGPQPKIPDVLLEVAATHSEISQVGSGGELRGRDFKRLIGAAVLGTKHEGKFAVNSAWKKLRARHPEKLQAANVATAEDARLRWTTYDNLQRWFDDAKADLIASGLAIDQEVVDEKGVLISEIDFRSANRGGDDVKRRIINMDETHHDLSITSEKGGPRATMYHNPNLQRGYKRTVKAGRHVTGVYATNADGEVLPPMYIFDSGATIHANFRVKVSWLDGLPTVEGRFGCPSRVESGSFFSVRSSGSMDDSLFNDYVERVILPLYPNISRTASFDPVTGKKGGRLFYCLLFLPNDCFLTRLCIGRLLCGPVILKVDSGPGRMVASAESISRRTKFLEMGLYILMGLPNATSVQQEMDVVYQSFKAATYARGEALLTHKLMVRGREQQENRRMNNGAVAAPLSIGFEDLAIVINGTADDGLDMKPFSKFFTKERIRASWEKVGFVPFTRKCVHHKKVRHELGQHGAARASVLEDLQEKYDDLVVLAENEGLNAGVFDGAIPVAMRVERATNEDEQVTRLVETKGSFSAGGLWNNCATRIGNASVVLRAQKAQIDIEAAKNAVQAQSRADRRSKAFMSAQTALQKYREKCTTMTDKDWVDIIRWVLPESKADGLMKDFKKADAIIAKLASLDREWTTYIPPIEAV